MKNSPEISFVVVNFNGIKDTRELIKSMEDNLGSLHYEVIVVDNGSASNEAYLLNKEFPHHLIIRSEKNLGFSGGNNIGIKASSGRNIMIINNDTILVDNSVCELVSMLDSNSSTGAVSPKIYYSDSKKLIQFAGYTELTKITLRNRAIGYKEYDTGQYDVPSETAFNHGAAMMIKREVLERVGYMPEIYFLYYEEFDWCYKIRAAGYKLMYQPAAVIIHKESQSTGSDSYLKRYYMTRNRILFACRNRKGFVRILAVLYQLFIADPKAFLLSVIKGRKDLALATIRGVMDSFKFSVEKAK